MKVMIRLLSIAPAAKRPGTLFFRGLLGDGSAPLLAGSRVAGFVTEGEISPEVAKLASTSHIPWEVEQIGSATIWWNDGVQRDVVFIRSARPALTESQLEAIKAYQLALGLVPEPASSSGDGTSGDVPSQAPTTKRGRRG